MRNIQDVGKYLLIGFLASVLLVGCGGDGSDDEDTSPDAFAFDDEDDVGLAQYIISDEIEIDGINTATDISIEGGEYSINDGEFTDEDGEIYNGNTLRVRVLSSDELSTETEATVTIGDEEDTFTVETVAIALTARDGFKNIVFSWPSVTGATSYQLLEKSEENAEFLEKGRALSSSATGYTMDVAIHKHDWLGAEYKLQACTNASCSTTDEISLYNYMRRSIGYLKASNTDANDNFGVVDISADGSTIAVGAPAEDSGSSGVNQDDGNNSVSGAGAVYVFVQSDEGWRMQAYLKTEFPGEGDGFGSSLSLSSDGNILVIGAPFEDSSGSAEGAADDSLQDSGAVFVYRRFGDVWFLQNQLKATEPNAGDRFGASVAISEFGATLLVAAPAYDSVDEASRLEGAGAVYLFSASGDNWQQTQKFEAREPQSGAAFGSSIALAANGNKFVVGSPYFRSQAADSALVGTVVIYQKASDEWLEVERLLASNYHDGMQFGASVSLSANGEKIVVGAPGDSSSGFGVGAEQTDLTMPDSGAVFVFGLQQEAWVQEVYLKAENSDESDRFGASVAVNANGDFIAVGADGESSIAQALHGNEFDNSAIDAGAVYTFEVEDTAWRQLSYVKAPNTDAGDFFGRYIALDAAGTSLLVGSPNEQSDATGLSGNQSNNSANKSGSAYLY